MNNQTSPSRNDLIKEMLAMQKKFIAREQAEGISQEQIYSAEDGSDWGAYQTRYTELANQLVEMAHADKGSKR